MCFSATVSFGASVAIGAIGVVALKKADTAPLKLFALTPMLFAFQQLTEGAIWLSLGNPEHQLSIFWLPILTAFYLIFAWVIWPFFIPLFMRNLEENQNSKRWLNHLTIIGFIVSITLLVILITSNVQAAILGKHITYTRELAIPGIGLIGIIYVICLLGPFLLTSRRKMIYLGSINLVSFLITRYAYEAHFISVWCFFAAISSVFVLAIVHEMQQEHKANSYHYQSLKLGR